MDKIIVAKNKYTGSSAQKTRLVAALVKKMNALDASEMLNFVNKVAGKHVKKAIDSAIANGKTLGYSQNKLFIDRILVDEAPTMKRGRIASRRGPRTILKRTSHITVYLTQKDGSQN